MGCCGMRMTFTEKRFFDQLDLLERAICLQYALKIWDVNTDKPVQLTHQIKCATFIRLARKFCRFFSKFLFYFFLQNNKLVFNDICSIAIYDLSPTLW